MRGGTTGIQSWEASRSAPCPFFERSKTRRIPQMSIELGLQLLEKQLRKGHGKRSLPVTSNQGQSRLHLGDHPGDEVRGALLVEGDDHRSSQENGIEGGNPGWPILSPENDAVPGSNPALAQLVRDLDHPPAQLPPGDSPRTDPVRRDNRCLIQTIPSSEQNVR